MQGKKAHKPKNGGNWKWVNSLGMAYIPFSTAPLLYHLIQGLWSVCLVMGSRDKFPLQHSLCAHLVLLG